MPLYFVALIPNDDLLNKINAIKGEIKERFGPKHALKLPPHITIQIPFKMSAEHEPLLEESLQNFTYNEEKLTIELNGYGAFKPRVVYVRIQEPSAIIELHKRLQEMLNITIGLQETERVTKLHPHITLATKDVKKEVFRDLWREFTHRQFQASFTAHYLFVFKHNGKTWDIWRKFPLFKL